MGLTVQTSFDTPEGFTVPSVYIRIGQVILSSLTSSPSALVFFEPVVSREKRGVASLSVPGMPTSATFQVPLADCIRFEVLYAYIKRDLEARGFVCTPVLEDGQTLVEYVIPEVSPQSSESTPPQPEPAPEPTPEASPQSSESTQTTPPTPPPPSESPESSPEPQQPPSSEYAPAPAATEA